MPDVKRSIKIITEQGIIQGADSGVEGFPLRHWSMKIVQIHAETKTDVDADIFDKVTYNLHPSFGDRAKQVLKKPPFKVEEDGWGEFDFDMVLTDAAGKDHPITHDLNFQQVRYETKHIITFKNPKGRLLELLRHSGPIPGEAAGTGADVNGTTSSKKRSSNMNEESMKRKKKADGRGIDMDKLADGLQKLGEDDLLQVVQMVHDNKGEDSWMRNDVDQGEFHVDLYTLPESLIKMLWEFTNERVGTS